MATLICPQCNTKGDVDETWRGKYVKCNCGNKVFVPYVEPKKAPPVGFCIACGGPVPEIGKFCPGCGKPTSAFSSISPGEVIKVPEAKDHSNYLTLTVLTFLLPIVGIVVGIVWLIRYNPNIFQQTALPRVFQVAKL